MYVDSRKVKDIVEKVNDNIKRFKSCFLCCVEMHDKFIMLEDSNKDRFYIDREDKVALESFVFWFKNVYIKGIPQVLTIIDYSYVNKSEDEVVCVVNKLIANPAVGNASENEHKDNSASNTTNESKEG